MPKSGGIAYFCEKCQKTMDVSNYYKTNNLEKYPTGVLPQCKKCITMHVDNDKPETYLWILQECDVPYVPSQWYALMERYGRDRSKLSGSTIVGRYLGKMRLDQFNRYRWKDTEYLRGEEEKRAVEALRSQGYEQQEIEKTIKESPRLQGAYVNTEEEIAIPEYVNAPIVDDISSPGTFTKEEEDYFDKNDPAANMEIDLTDEERLRLRLKWGKMYKPAEWVQLEQLYDDMMESYDIQTAGHIDTLKFICKTSLKMNQLIDIGDGTYVPIKLFKLLEAAQVISSQFFVLLECRKVQRLSRWSRISKKEVAIS